MQFHKFSEIFPLLDSSELDALTADIKSFGLREKIWLYQGKVLDGRNRFLACQKAKVRPQFRTFKGTDAGALALVVSTNIQRRHLTLEQRAMAAARVATLKKGGDPNTARAALTQAEAAEKFDVSPDSIQRARKVVEQGSKALQEAVESGDVPLKKAAEVVQLPKREQLAAAISKPEKPEEPESDLMPEPEPLSAEEMAEMDEAAERARQEFSEKIMAADDRLAAAESEVQRLARDLANMTRHRDHWMNQAGANAKFAKRLQGVIKKKDREIEALRGNAAA